MKQPATKSDRQRTATARNTTHRKKLIAASILLAIMIAMWARVLSGKKRPAAVSAAPAAAQSIAAAVQDEGVEYIQLPHISGRHDLIVNDVFSAENFRRFVKPGQYSADTGLYRTEGTAGTDSPAELAAEALKLDAIISGKRPQAFIENKLFGEGQSFRFMFREQVYNFKVLKIFEDRIELDCNGIIITKKIPQPF
ncbi:MAG: hypothetical protein PHQ00_01975 [Phycisphaerae bacterium]|nr:hypothetical protein [Phycisphaerae bacterium]